MSLLKVISFAFFLAVLCYGDDITVAENVLPKDVPRSAVSRGLAPHGFMGDRSHLHAALLRSVQDKHLRIGIVGGSVPYGHDLKSRSRERSLAYKDQRVASGPPCTSSGSHVSRSS